LSLGAVQEIVTFDPVTVVVGAFGFEGVRAAKIVTVFEPVVLRPKAFLANT
jgi:hypothetical protein